jgi:hypothetical protein
VRFLPHVIDVTREVELRIRALDAPDVIAHREPDLGSVPSMPGT